jgi:FKBP-type peptidyl-prolyl cis-trans isomerase
MCEVVQGLHDAVATMRQQEVAQFKIGPEYAYRMGIPDLIPANATLLYEVELLGKTQVSYIRGSCTR